MKQPTHKLLFVLIVFLFTTIAQRALCQRWSVGVRPSISFPKNTSTGNMSTGFGIEGKTFYNFESDFHAYAGWGWNLFAAATKADFSYDESGFTFGIQYNHRVAGSKLKYFLGAGGVYTHLETENKNLNFSEDSGHAPGWQVESGLMFTIEQRFRIKPGIRYRNVSANDLRYFSFGVEFQY